MSYDPAARLRELSPDLPDATFERVVDFAATLVKWNRRFSFTSMPDGDVVDRLIAPSVWLGARYGEEFSGITVADFGTGVGIPGLVMGLVDEKNRYSLIDSAGKKISFIRQFVATRGLTDRVAVEECRWRPEMTEGRGIDRVVSRAAGSISEVTALFPGVSSFDFFKGGDAGEEMAAFAATSPDASATLLTAPDWFGDLRVVRVRG